MRPYILVFERYQSHTKHSCRGVLSQSWPVSQRQVPAFQHVARGCARQQRLKPVLDTADRGRSGRLDRRFDQKSHSEVSYCFCTTSLFNYYFASELGRKKCSEITNNSFKVR